MIGRKQAVCGAKEPNHKTEVLCRANSLVPMCSRMLQCEESAVKSARAERENAATARSQRQQAEAGACAARAGKGASSRSRPGRKGRCGRQ